MANMQEALESLSDKNIRHIVSVSGGKDSTALALYMRQSFPEIPAEYVFCDTGCELPETYEYLERLEALLGVEVKRLNALDDLKVARKPGRNPFDMYLNELYGGFLPNPAVAMVHEGAEDSAVRALRRRQPCVQLHWDPRRRGQRGIPIEEATGDLAAAEHPAGVSVQGRGDDPGGHQANTDRIRHRVARLLPVAIPFRLLFLFLPAGRGVAEPEGGAPGSLRESDEVREG